MVTDQENPCSWFWHDGVKSILTDARISWMTPALLYGESVFETIRMENGVPLFMEAHLSRLESSLETLEIEVKDCSQRVLRGIQELSVEMEKNILWRIRVTVLRDAISMNGLDFKSTDGHVFITATPLEVDDDPSGISAKVVNVKKIPPECLDPSVKHGNYLNNLIAQREARKAGFDAAVMLTMNGDVAESATANIFWCHDQNVYTCSREYVLPGITRQWVLEQCRKQGFQVHEGLFSVKELFLADEIFFSSSIQGLAYVSKLDHQSWSDAPGPMTRKLLSLYQESCQSMAGRSVL
ncbi:MAG: aminotransferase class IV [Planctomycetes bacterium]|nr:aminotransferase class IV [Planctomycetota bacterium]